MTTEKDSDTQNLINDLFALLDHAQWRNPESAKAWRKRLEQKAVELGFKLEDNPPPF